MTRMNHTKISMRARIASEARLYRAEPEYAAYSKHSYSEPKIKVKGSLSWIKFLYGPHAGEYLPEIMVRDPGYVIHDLYKSGRCFKCLDHSEPKPFSLKLAHQLQVLINRSQNMLVPMAKRATQEFGVVLDEQRVFQSVILVKKGKKPKLDEGCILLKRTEKFSLDIPRRHKKPTLGFKRMTRTFNKIFFEDEAFDTADGEIVSVFSDMSNFDLSECSSHTCLAVSSTDTAALRILTDKPLKRH